MKRSERLIRSTIVGLTGLMVLYVGISRLSAGSTPAHATGQTSVAELARLRDFSAIQVDGNFSLDVVQDAAWSVAFAPSEPGQGSFYAAVHDNTLVLHGFRNTPASRVTVTLPALSKLAAHKVTALSVSGFAGANLSLELGTTARVTLRNNSIRQWHIDAAHVGDLRLDRASIGAGRVDLAGRANFTVID
jgi:hypothetical protein